MEESAVEAMITKTSSQEHFEVVIVGSGFSGLLCAIELKDAGIENVRIFEMTPSVGGVWSKGGVGAYPGAACDVPAYTYLPLLDRSGFIPFAVTTCLQVTVAFGVPLCGSTVVICQTFSASPR